jgi:hypothetical protein
MNILITGKKGLADGLKKVYESDKNNLVQVISRPDFDIHNVSSWGEMFVDSDLLYNCAYDNDGQLKVLECFARLWSDDPSKTIVTIGSMSADYPRLEIEKNQNFWMYRYHKKILQEAVRDLRSECHCDLRIYNPGAIDTQMIKHLSVPKYNILTLAHQIKQLTEMSGLKRVDLWQ